MLQKYNLLEKTLHTELYFYGCLAAEARDEMSCYLPGCDKLSKF